MKYAEVILQLFLAKLKAKKYEIYSIYPSKKNGRTIYHIKLSNGLKMVLEPDRKLPKRDNAQLFSCAFHRVRFITEDTKLIEKICFDLWTSFQDEIASYSIKDKVFIYMETNKDT